METHMSQGGSQAARFAIYLLYISACLEVSWIIQILYLDTLLLELDYHSWDAFRNSFNQKSGAPWLLTGLFFTFLVYQTAEFMYHLCMVFWNIDLYTQLEKAGKKNFRYGPLMAIVAWLVPIASLIMPLWIMQELQSLVHGQQEVRLSRWWLMEFLPAILSIIAFTSGFLSGNAWLALGIYLLGRGVFFYHGMESIRIIRAIESARVSIGT